MKTKETKKETILIDKKEFEYLFKIYLASNELIKDKPNFNKTVLESVLKDNLIEYNNLKK